MGLEFQRLMLLYTLPLYWSPRPVFHARRLKDFLAFLLDPTKAGFAALGIRESRDSSSFQWLYGDDTIRWINTTFNDLWQPYSENIERFGRGFAEEAFHAFVQKKAEIFMDGERFLACYESINGIVDKKSNINISNFYIGFSVDWSFSGTLLWTPQLRISNFWPVNLRLAPPPPSSAPSPPAPMDAHEAAHLLEDIYWKELETIFRSIRMHFDLGSAYVGLEGRRWVAPVFYYAEPASMPKRPEQLLEEGATDLTIIARKVLGIEDLFTEGTSGDFLMGNLFVFRRELIGEETVFPLYLILPWGDGPRDQWGDEVEREVVFTADKLSFLEFSVGFESYDVLTDLAIPNQLMALWAGSLDDAPQLLRELQDQIAFAPRLGRKRTQAFRMIHHLETGLTRLEAEIIRATDQVFRAERNLEAAIRSTELFARRAFNPRPIPGVQTLLEGLKESYPYRMAGSIAQLAADRARQIRSSFRSSLEPFKQTIYGLIEEEKRDEREREERNQRILSYALASLAAVTALPLIIGQMGWAELQETMGRWPQPFVRLFPFLQMIQPMLTFISIVAAVGIIAVLMSVIIRTFLPPMEDPEEREWKRNGRILAEAWNLIHRSRPQILSLREQAFVSRRIPGEPESSEIQQKRRQIEEWDEQICEHLIQVWEQIKRYEEQEQKSNDRLTALHHRIHRFTLALELLGHRPAPLPFPRALCLYRYKSTDFVASSVVSDFEFEQVLNGYGFDDDEVHAIDEWVERPLQAIPELNQRYPILAQQGKRLRDLPPRDFVWALKEIVGVSAMHEREIKSQTQENLEGLLKRLLSVIRPED